MEINFWALIVSMLFAATVFIVIWLLEGFLMERRVHVSTSATGTSEEKHEHIHVDIPSSAISNTEETISEPISKEDSSEHEPLGSTSIRVESTEQPKLCPVCHSSLIVKRGFADKAHRKQRYLCRNCRVTFLREAAIEAD